MGSGLPRAHRRSSSALLTADRGYGPLLQRDYWAVVANARLRPSQVMQLVRARFAELAPEELVRFGSSSPGRRALGSGDELAITIRGAGRCAVRVIHEDAQSLTLGTLPGHPEAGRITFGAYRNRRGALIFHIRSRARSSARSRYLGFAAVGEAMQTNTWAEFVDRVALTVGTGVRGEIHVETQKLAGEPGADVEREPTFRARGD